MTQRVRHIWARAGQHIKVHRRRPRPSGGENEDDDKALWIIIGIIVFIWVVM